MQQCSWQYVPKHFVQPAVILNEPSYEASRASLEKIISQPCRILPVERLSWYPGRFPQLTSLPSHPSMCGIPFSGDVMPRSVTKGWLWRTAATESPPWKWMCHFGETLNGLFPCTSTFLGPWHTKWPPKKSSFVTSKDCGIWMAEWFSAHFVESMRGMGDGAAGKRTSKSAPSWALQLNPNEPVGL